MLNKFHLSAERRQFLRYAAVGLMATAVHYAALNFNLKVLHLNYAGVANLLAALAGISASFLGNKFFAFRDARGRTLDQAIRFGILYALIAFLHGAIMYMWADVAGFDYRVGFLLATVVQFVSSFFGNKLLVFKH